MALHRFQIVPAAYVFLRRGDEVLLQYRTNTGYMDERWAAGAAGHVESGESVLDAAVREAAEELGIQIERDRLVPLTSLHRTDGSENPIEQRVDWMFTASEWDGEPRTLEATKSGGLAWFSLDALPLLPPHERYVLERWRLGMLRGIETFGFDLPQG